VSRCANSIDLANDSVGVCLDIFRLFGKKETAEFFITKKLQYLACLPDYRRSKKNSACRGMIIPTVLY
jgi:hypothetical protein